MLLLDARSRVRPTLMSGSPCTKFIPAITATLFMSSLRDNRGNWGERLTGIHKTDLPEVYLHTSSPNVLVINFLIICLPSPDIQPESSATAINGYVITHLAFLLPGKVSNQVHYLKFWEDLPSHCHSGMFQRGTIIHLSIFRWCLQVV